MQDTQIDFKGLAAEKVCSKCGILKPFSRFSKKPEGKFGLRSYCKDCQWKHLREQRLVNPLRFRRHEQNYRDKDKLRYREKSKRYYNKNKEKKLLKNSEWRSKNREKTRLLIAEWSKKNRPRINAIAIKRRCRFLRATPSWADHSKIRNFYEAAHNLTAQTGIKHSVDHIIPLQGRTVCGFHSENNLRVITASQNSSKGNRMVAL